MNARAGRNTELFITSSELNLIDTRFYHFQHTMLQPILSKTALSQEMLMPTSARAKTSKPIILEVLRILMCNYDERKLFNLIITILIK